MVHDVRGFDIFSDAPEVETVRTNNVETPTTKQKETPTTHTTPTRFDKQSSNDSEACSPKHPQETEPDANATGDNFYDCVSPSLSTPLDGTRHSIHEVEISNSILSKSNRGPQGEPNELPSPLPLPFETPKDRILDTSLEANNVDEINNSKTEPTVPTQEQSSESANCTDPERRNCNSAQTVIFAEQVDSNEICESLSQLSPQLQYPVPATEIWNASQSIKKGTMCTVAWAFDNQERMNVSIGRVTSIYKRKGFGKLSIQYTGVVGHKPDQEFSGTIPSHDTVRIYKLYWHTAPPTPKSPTEPENVASPVPAALPVLEWSDDDLDHTPIPTARVIKPESIPGVIATFREIMSEYIQSSYPERYKIWHSVLSAMKTSLADIQRAGIRRSRRRPLSCEMNTCENEESKEEKTDKRAIKKATRLMIEGSTKKATQILDRKFAAHQLSDKETLQKLQDLHPQSSYEFDLPRDAPILGGLHPTEFRRVTPRQGSQPGAHGNDRHDRPYPDR